MNFSRKVKEKADEVLSRLNVKILQITTATSMTDGPRVISRARVIDPDALLVMIRRYEQRIEWAFKASIRREVEILRLRKKVAKLEARIMRRKPIQTELFEDTSITVAEAEELGREIIDQVSPRAEDIIDGAGTPFHGGSDNANDEQDIQGGEETDRL